MNSPETSTRSSPLDGARAALLLLTRLPVGDGALSGAGLARAPAFFPLVGLLLGGLGALLLELLRPRLGSSLGVLLVLVVGAFLTGALHEDGLADTADAWGGASGGGQAGENASEDGQQQRRQRLFAILKDPRHGTYGVLALVLSVALRWACLQRLDPAAAGALLLTACWSRACLVPLMATLPYVTPAATASSGPAARATVAQALAAGALAILTAVGLCAVGLCEPRATATAGAGAVLITAFLGWRFRALAGGITGDFLGATQQSTEITMLLLLIASA